MFFHHSHHPEIRAVLAAIALVALTFPVTAADSLDEAAAAYRTQDYSAAIDLTGRILKEDPSNREAATLNANAHQARGVQNFFDARIDASIADFDVFLKQYPERAPHHWQRGISLYYADRFKDGQKQFETHQTVNTQDVENAVWHFLCVSKVKDLGPEEARAQFIEITADRRVPMKEVHALFKGTGAEEAVMDAAESASGDRKNALCYAHLYLGLYHEALGDAKTSLEHIRKAAVDYAQDHYMGQVAKVHLALRSGKAKQE